MARDHEEVEWKYDVDDDFVLPPVPELLAAGDDGEDGKAGSPGFDAARPNVARLEATYFDTADHRLLHAGLTLRRRTGGSDAGWHLKVRVADDERREIHAALGRSERTVPLRLRRLVWIHTRGAALVPVLRLSTKRTESPVGQNGSVLAQIADDRVVAERLAPTDRDDSSVPETVAPQAWRELEVELVDGDRDLLEQVDRQLRRRGATRSASRSKLARGLGRPAGAGKTDPGKNAPTGKTRKLSGKSPAGDVLVDYLAAEVAQVADNDLAVRLDLPESIHRMRVATRRLRGALRTFRGLLEPGAVKPLERELKWLAGELGAARDAEVLRDRLAAQLTAERSARRATSTTTRAVEREMVQAQRGALSGVQAALDSERYQLLVTALDELVGTPPLTDRAARPARKELRGPVRRAAGKVDAAIARAASTPAGPERSAAWHEVRKDAKRARYAGEAVRAAFGRPAASLASAMEQLQDLLGEHHDSVVLQDRLEELAQDSPADRGFTLGRLHAAQDQRQAELEGSIREASKAATRKSLRAWLA
jgi:CHAD domain-containing protein